MFVEDVALPKKCAQRPFWGISIQCSRKMKIIEEGGQSTVDISPQQVEGCGRGMCGIPYEAQSWKFSIKSYIQIDYLLVDYKVCL